MMCKRLILWRNQANLSQKDAAEKFGVTQAAISKIERGSLAGVALAQKIEKTTNGFVSKSDLRPDIWPAAFVPQLKRNVSPQNIAGIPSSTHDNGGKA